MKDCILENKVCDNCGECDICDLDRNKKCNNCGKCIESDAEYLEIAIDSIIGADQS